MEVFFLVLLCSIFVPLDFWITNQSVVPIFWFALCYICSMCVTHDYFLLKKRVRVFFFLLPPKNLSDHIAGPIKSFQNGVYNNDFECLLNFLAEGECYGYIRIYTYCLVWSIWWLFSGSVTHCTSQEHTHYRAVYGVLQQFTVVSWLKLCKCFLHTIATILQSKALSGCCGIVFECINHRLWISKNHNLS